MPSRKKQPEAAQRPLEEIETSERRLRLLFNSIPATIWTTDTELRITSGEGASQITNQSVQDQTIGLSIRDIFGNHADGDMVYEHHRRALGGESCTYEVEWSGITFHSHVEPLRDAAGVIQGVIGVALDITTRKRAEQALRNAHDQLEERVRERTAELQQANQDLQLQNKRRARVEIALRRSEEHFRELAESNKRLLRELDHRVRNNIAGLLSLVSIMRSGTHDVDTFAAAIEGRLRGMSQVHDLLCERAGGPVALNLLARRLLDTMAMALACGRNTSLKGPAVLISSRQALPLSMILLEWFTNFCKHGACRSGTGQVNVSWQVEQSADEKQPSMIHLQWTESGGPTLTEPVVPSLGTELVHSFASLELRGSCEMTYPAAGAAHALHFPMDLGIKEATAEKH